MTIPRDTKDSSITNPFAYAAALYRDAGWVGTIPLRTGQKNPLVAGYHGGDAPYPDAVTVAEWCKVYGNANIGLRLSDNVVDENGEVWEICGIDVDEYVSGTGDEARVKLGGEQLGLLEDEIGRLPATAVSSSRLDGTSGIRYFRVPRGLHWRDPKKADGTKGDIEVIWKGNRYAAVWPSIHPEGRQYRWHEPGCPLDDSCRCSGEIPDPAALPVLPQPWIDFLTQGRIEFSTQPIDMDSTDDEIDAWCETTFNKWTQESMCSAVRHAQDKWCNAIRKEATSYDKITDGHWELYSLAAEMHTGWYAAIQKLEKTYCEEVSGRGKRPMDVIFGEITRSRNGAIRKIKANVGIRTAQAAAIGARLGDRDLCPTEAQKAALAVWAKKLKDAMTQQNTPTGKWAGKIKCPNPNVPLLVAKWVMGRASKKNPVKFWHGQFWTWNGTHWVPVSSDEMNAALIEGLGAVYYEDKDDPDQPVWWNPNRTRISEVVASLKGIAFLDSEIETQSWFDGREDQMISCRNGLVRITDRKRFDHSSQYFNTFSLPFDYDPDAQPGELVEFLKSTLPDDEEAKRALRMWFGYFISGMTDQQKMLTLVGLPRSGKGTIAAMLKMLMGKNSHASVNATELNKDFGLQPLIGKTLGIFADAQVNVTGRLFIERLLSITGEDDQNVNIKGLPQMLMKLAIRFLFLSNIPPIINDPSGAIVNRMITINLPGDFSEKPDLGLQKRLLNPSEMSGTLNWALDGLDDLLDRGDLGFIQPTSGKGILAIAGEGASPIKSFINEKYILDKDSTVLKSEVFHAWKTWCGIHGYEPGKEGIARNDVHFARDLYAAFNKKIVGERIMVDGQQQRFFRGLRPVPMSAAGLRIVKEQL